MRLVGWLLVVMAVVLGAVGITMDPVSRKGLMVGAGVLLGVGLLIALIATLMNERSRGGSDRRQQMKQFEKLSESFQSGSMTSTGGVDRSDPMAILKTVMDAQSESGGDPEALAKALRERLGGDPTVIQGGSQSSFSSGDGAGVVEQLTRMRDSGMITDEQLQQAKNQLPGT